MGILSDEPAIGFYSSTQVGGLPHFTLTTLLSAFLLELEERYGERDRNFTIVGVEVGEQDRPCIWFPNNPRHACIRLGRFAAVEWDNAVVKLAHECVHLLSPATGSAHVIEEGIAANFELEVAERYAIPFSLDPVYGFYRDRYLELDTINSQAIKILRRETPYFRQWTPSFMRRSIPEMPENLAEILCTSSEGIEAEFVRSGTLPSS